MTERNYDYMEDLKIDQFSLDTECVEQPRKFMKYAEAYAQAMFNRDKAKQDLKVLFAKKQLFVRQQPPSVYGLDKFTEATIQALLDQDVDLQAAETKLMETEKDMQIMRGAKDAFMDRKQELLNLVALDRAKYFADPTPEAKAAARASALGGES